jgi:MOSC domain-containing protein YiiM
MEQIDEARLAPDFGVEGDARGKPGRRQVTILFLEDWAAACFALGAERPWITRRANLLVEGLYNPRAAGGTLAIGKARLLITGECDPCQKMDAAWPGLQDALKPNWRGGLTATVIEGGDIETGFGVRLL